MKLKFSASLMISKMKGNQPSGVGEANESIEVSNVSEVSERVSREDHSIIDLQLSAKDFEMRISIRK